jgi:arginine exporter protein ArgO
MRTQTLVSGGAAISEARLWAGRIMSGLAVLFLLWDGVMKLLKPAMVVKATRELGYPESDIVGIGAVLLACTLLYIFPRTSILGAILLTGYLGGAIASQVRAQASWFNVVFAFVFACLVWGGLWLRDIRVRNFLPYQH